MWVKCFLPSRFVSLTRRHALTHKHVSVRKTYTPQIVYKVSICPRGNLPYSQITSTGFSCQGRAKLRVGVLNVPWPEKSKPLEIEGFQKAHHNKTPLSSCSSVLNLFLFMFTHLSTYVCTFVGIFPLPGTQLSPSLTRKPCNDTYSVQEQNSPNLGTALQRFPVLS